MTFVYEEGEQITVGSHGDHDFVFAGGNRVPDAGVSDLVFEAGTGLGGVSLVVEGTEIGFYNSSETHSEWYDYTVGSDKPDDAPNAVGLWEDGVDDTQGHYVYVLGHYDTQNETYVVCAWYTHKPHDEEFSGDEGQSARSLRFDGLDLAKNPGSPVIQDGPTSNDSSFSADDDEYGTDGSGNPATSQVYGVNAGDGVGYELSSGTTEFTIDVGDKEQYLSDDRDLSNYEDTYPPDGARSRGPVTSETISLSGGIDVKVVIP